MNHRRKKKHLNRTPAHRTSLLRNLSAALIDNERIETTEAKAKALRPFIEKLITLGKKETIAARRIAGKKLYNDRERIAKLFNDIAPRFKDREGGYTRIIKIRSRTGDNAPLAMIEFVDKAEKQESSDE